MFGRKKESAIDRRLRELQSEMAKVGGEIKAVARSQKGRGHDSAPPPLGPRLAEAEPKPAENVPGDAPSSAGTDNMFVPPPKGDETDISLAPDATLGGESSLPLFERRPPLSSDGREKFANYFMAGHFQNLRPLRQEKRIVRNKAIVMIVLVVLALVWLVFSLSSQ